MWRDILIDQLQCTKLGQAVKVIRKGGSIPIGTLSLELISDLDMSITVNLEFHFASISPLT